MSEIHGKHNIHNEIAIDISGKKLGSFPNLMFSNLQLLYLGNNDMRNLPENLFKEAPLLKWLDVRNNLLETIPISIKNHQRLETMLLQNNKISYLPIELGTVKSLKYVQLNGNPIIYPKKSIVKLGTEAVLKYLRLQYIQENSSDIGDNFIDVSLKQTDSSNKPIIESKDNNEKKFGKRISIVDSSNGTGDIVKQKANMIKKEYANSNKYVTCERPKSKDEQTILIQENLFKDIWTERKKEILNRRERALQNRKSLAALKNWRHNYKNTKHIEPSTFYALDLSHIPFDIDLNHVKILTRADIEKDLPDKYKKNIGIKLNTKSAKHSDKTDVRTKIAQLAESFHSIQTENFEWTPRTERKMIGHRIQKLTDIKNKIVKLKLDNDKSLE